MRPPLTTIFTFLPGDQVRHALYPKEPPGVVLEARLCVVAPLGVAFEKFEIRWSIDKDPVTCAAHELVKVIT